MRDTDREKRILAARKLRSMAGYALPNHVVCRFCGHGGLVRIHSVRLRVSGQDAGGFATFECRAVAACEKRMR